MQSAITLEELAAKAIPVLKANGVIYVAVFGSVARGEATETSDVDILARFANPVSLLDHIGVAFELEDTLQRKVDLVTESSLKQYIAPYIKKDLKVLYGRGTQPDLQ